MSPVLRRESWTVASDCHDDERSSGGRSRAGTRGAASRPRISRLIPSGYSPCGRTERLASPFPSRRISSSTRTPELSGGKPARTVTVLPAPRLHVSLHRYGCSWPSTRCVAEPVRESASVASSSMTFVPLDPFFARFPRESLDARICERSRLRDLAQLVGRRPNATFRVTWTCTADAAAAIDQQRVALCGARVARRRGGAAAGRTERVLAAHPGAKTLREDRRDLLLRQPPRAAGASRDAATVRLPRP